MRIEFSSDFEDKLKKYKRKDNTKYKKILRKIAFFKNNPRHPSLRIHKLKGELREYWSFWVEGDLRILYIYQEDKITFLDIGTHREIYK